MSEQKSPFYENPGYVYQPQTTDAADLLKEIFKRMDEEKKEIVKRLSGIIKVPLVDENGVFRGWTEVYDKDAILVNQKGIQRILLLLEPAFSGDKATTNITEQDVENLSMNSGNEIMKVLELNAKEYGIKPEDWGVICKLILSKNLLALRAAQKGGLIKTLRSIYEIKQQEVISQYSENMPKKKGFLGFMFGGKK